MYRFALTLLPLVANQPEANRSPSPRSQGPVAILRDGQTGRSPARTPARRDEARARSRLTPDACGSRCSTRGTGTTAIDA